MYKVMIFLLQGVILGTIGGILVNHFYDKVTLEAGVICGILAGIFFRAVIKFKWNI